jgi:trimeric autotransporter adhesin
MNINSPQNRDQKAASAAKELTMRTIFLSAVIALTAVSSMEAQVHTSSKAGGNASAAATKGNNGIEAGTALRGELQKTLDVRNARVGDEVVLKTTRTVKTTGGTVIEKGSKLVGRITEVKQKAGGEGLSRIGMVFDRLEGKGLDLPITASIVSITAARAAAAAGDQMQAETMGSSRTTASASGPAGGGLLGGVGSTVGGVMNSTTATAGNVVSTAGQTVGSTVYGATSTVNGVSSGLNGLQINNSVSGSANSSATLSTPNKSLRIEKGATFGLLISRQGNLE